MLLSTQDSHQDSLDPVPPLVPPLAPQILKSRAQYCCCHVYTDESSQRLAAILVHGKYYSFFRVEKSQDRAVEIANRLASRGNFPLITQMPTGFGLWVLEPGAYPIGDRRSSVRPAGDSLSPSPYKILASRHQYKTCYIQVPDLDKRLAAIFLDGHYYSLFKIVETIQDVLQIAQRLKCGREEAVITKLKRGYGLWVLEPNAMLL